VFELVGETFHGAFDMPSGDTGLRIGNHVVVVNKPRVLNVEQSRQLIEERKRVLYASQKSLEALEGRGGASPRHDYSSTLHDRDVAAATPRRQAPAIGETPFGEPKVGGPLGDWSHAESTDA
jgi:hypothetical protein